MNSLRRVWLELALVMLAPALPVWSDDVRNQPVEKPISVVTLHHAMHLATHMAASDIPDFAVTNLTASGGDCCETPHYTPSDLKILAQADALVVGTALPQELAHLTRPGATLISAQAGIPFVPSDDTNPHVWMSPLMFASQVDVISAQLGALRPECAEALRVNARRTAQDLGELAAEMRDTLTRIPSRRVVAYHDAFPYFAADLGIEVVAVVQEKDEEPPPSRLADVIRIMKETDTRIILVEEGGSSEKTANLISAETGARVCTIDTFLDGDMSASAYADTMRSNLSRLLAAFSAIQSTNPAPGK